MHINYYHRLITFIIGLLLVTTNSFATPYNADSVAVDPVKSQRSKLNKSLTTAETDTYMAMCDTLYRLGISTDDNSAMLDSYFFRITHLADQGLAKEALSELDALKTLSEKLGDTKILYETWCNLIVVYYIRNNNSIGAISEITKMQNHALEAKDNFGLGMSYCAMGTCYDYAPELAIRNYEKSIEYFKKTDSEDMLSYAYCLICQTEGDLKNWDDVIDYAKLIKEIENKGTSYSYFADMMLLRAYTHLGMQDEASTVFDYLKRTLHNNDFSANSKTIFGYVATEYLCKYGKPDDAVRYIDMIGNEEDHLTAEITYYTAIEDYKKALQLSNELEDVRAIGLNEYVTAQFENANAHFNNQALMLEKEHLTVKYQRILMVSAIILMIILICWVIYLKSLLRKLSKTEKELIKSNAEIRKHEEETLAREQMKTSFIQFMSHEIRTPLNAINGFSSLLIDNKCDDAERQKFTDLLHSNVSNLTRILDKIIEMSDLITERDNLDTETVDIIPLLRRLVYNMEAANINGLKISLDAAQSCIISTNDIYFTTLFKNLLENAIKFTPSGSINIRCQNSNDDDSVIISVTDTGIGIPADKRDWVFDRFTKIDDFKPGIGVGLYICREIIQCLGGEIYIDANYTGGTRIIVKHPRKQTHNV